ncbi:MAG: M23 family metallopeptidase [Verrucomicrobiota bacterium]
MKTSVWCAFCFLCESLFVPATQAEEIALASGFDYPVGGSKAEGFYVRHAFRVGLRTAEIWEGIHGGDTDLGEPVYSIAEGTVVMSHGPGGRWGGVVIVRHRYRDHDGQIRFVDSLYAHVRNRTVRVGDRVARGQKIAEIGKGENDRLAAHLRFEIRKDLSIGLNSSAYPKDLDHYHCPRTFIKERRSVGP